MRLLWSGSNYRENGIFRDNSALRYYDVCMRTTLNINDDLMLLLKEKSRTVNKNLTSLVNELLRSSLIPVVEQNEPFCQKTYPLGEHPGINFHKAMNLAAEMETEYSIRKME